MTELHRRLDSDIVLSDYLICTNDLLRKLQDK